MIFLMNANTIILILAFLVKPIWMKIVLCALQGVCLWFACKSWNEMIDGMTDLFIAANILLDEKLKQNNRDDHC